MTETLDAALASLSRELFYRAMADAEAALRADPAAWDDYVAQRDEWLDAKLAD